MVTTGLSRTVSKINGDFRRKSQIFPTSRIFSAPAEGVPLELGIGARGQKAQMMELPDGRKSFKIGLVYRYLETRIRVTQGHGKLYHSIRHP